MSSSTTRGTKNRLFQIGIFLILTVGMLGIIPGVLPFRVNKELVCEWSIIFFIALCLKNKWVSFLVIWSLINSVLTLYVPQPVMVSRAYILTLHMIVFFAVAYNFISEKSIDIDKILNFICVRAIISVVVMGLQYLGVWILILQKNVDEIPKYFMAHPLPRVSFVVFKNNVPPLGFMDNPMTTGAFLALCLPAFFRKKWCMFLPMIFLGIFANKVMGAIIPAGVISILFIIWKWRRKGLLCCLLVLLGVLVWVYFNEPASRLLSFNRRMPVWNFAINELIPRKGIVGWGIGQAQFLPYIPIFEGIIDRRWVHYHNEFINLTIELGYIGLILFLGYLGSLLWRLDKCLKDEKAFLIFLGIVVALLNMMVNFPLHNPLGILIITYFALADKLARDRRRI